MACASGAASIALGADLVRAGVTPTALVGGVDALTHICFMGFNALKVLDPLRAAPSTGTAGACDRRSRASSSSRTPTTAGPRRARPRAAHRLRDDDRRPSRDRAAPEGEGMIHAMEQASPTRA